MAYQYPVKGQSPEPWASSIDIITASQALEGAIHAKKYSKIQSYLGMVDKYLSYSQMYLTAGAAAYPLQATVYNHLVGQVVSARQNLSQLEKGVPKTGFSQYQKGPLYDYQGVLGSLYRGISVLIPE